LWKDKEKEVIQQVRDATEGRGADVCVDAVGFEPDRSILDRAKAVINLEKGSPKVLEACMSAVRRGGLSPYWAYILPLTIIFPLGNFLIRASY
jgi:threonine dehydrogenase-like Zn-dependent dehydrogenase